jgi:hypothetical protein
MVAPLAAALLLLACVPALAAKPAKTKAGRAEEKVTRGIFEELAKLAPAVDFESALLQACPYRTEKARKRYLEALAQDAAALRPPRAEPKELAFEYLHVDGVRVECAAAGKKLRPDEGGTPAAAFFCGSAKLRSPILIGVGRGAWELAWDGADFSKDRIAAIVAHEMGHAALLHGYLLELQIYRLYNTWLADEAPALESVLRKRHEAAFGKKELDSEEKRLVGEAVDAELWSSFEQEHGDFIDELSRESEKEADDFAVALLGATSKYRPQAMNETLRAAHLRYLLSGVVNLGDGSHPSESDRTDRLFLEASRRLSSGR